MRLHVSHLTFPIGELPPGDFVLGPWALVDEDRESHSLGLFDHNLPIDWYQTLRDSDFLEIDRAYSTLLEQSRSQWRRMSGGGEIDSKTWELLIGWWLNDFLSSSFEVWSCAEKLVRSGKSGFDVAVADLKCPTRPLTSAEFSKRVKDGRWQQIISLRALTYLGVRYKMAEVTSRHIPTTHKNSRAVDIYEKFLLFSAALSKQTGLYKSYFHRSVVAQIIPAVAPNLSNLGFAVEFLVKALSKSDDVVKTPGGDEFETGFGFYDFAASVFWELMPLKVIRNLHLLSKESRPRKSQRLAQPSLLTSNAYANDEDFALLASLVRRRGGRLLIGQHGGNYGFGRALFTEQFETSVSDKFLTWGWSKDPRQVPIGNYSQRTYVGKKVQSRYKVLLVMNSVPPVLYQRASIPLGELESRQYLEDQLETLAKILEHVNGVALRPPLYFRPKWFEAELQDIFSQNLSLQDLSNVHLTFPRDFGELTIHASNTTSILESAFHGKPWKAIWRDDVWQTSSEAEELKMELIESRILHLSVDSLVEDLIEMGGDYWDWWDKSGLQASQRFAKTYSSEVNWRAMRDALWSVGRGSA